MPTDRNPIQAIINDVALLARVVETRIQDSLSDAWPAAGDLATRLGKDVLEGVLATWNIDDTATYLRMRNWTVRSSLQAGLEDLFACVDEDIANIIAANSFAEDYKGPVSAPVSAFCGPPHDAPAHVTLVQPDALVRYGRMVSVGEDIVVVPWHWLRQVTGEAGVFSHRKVAEAAQQWISQHSWRALPPPLPAPEQGSASDEVDMILRESVSRLASLIRLQGRIRDAIAGQNAGEVFTAVASARAELDGIARIAMVFEGSSPATA